MADNPELPGEVLDRFVARADARLCADLAYRDDLTAEQVRVLARRGGTDTTVVLVRRGLLRADVVDGGDPWVVLALLDEHGAPQEWAGALASHPDPRVRERLAGAAHTPPDLVAALARDENVGVVAEAALSPSLTAGLARSLAGHPHAEVRRALAHNEKTPPGVLAALVADGGHPPIRHCEACPDLPDRREDRWCTGSHEGAIVDIQCAALRNQATPADAAASLVTHPGTLVRWALASRVDLSQEVYRRLATDPIPGVRADVAVNPAIDESLMRDMSGDRTHDVQRRLAHNPNVPLDVLSLVAGATRIGPTLVSRVATASLAEVHTPATSSVSAVRMLVAQRRDLPDDVIHGLARDPDAKVLKSVAPNPAVSDDELHAMLTRHGPRVAARVARNPRCSEDLLYRVATLTPPVQKAYREIARHPNATSRVLELCLRDDQARQIAARHPALPVPTLLRLLDDARPRVVEAAAANPALPEQAMRALLGQ
ncbi:MAG TPA: hypothetical protein VJT31_21180 [Rugosimonospora sp.]|nr:hypothetical protein [Rugosimonospora sp.]